MEKHSIRNSLPVIHSHTGLRGLAAMIVCIAHVALWHERDWCLTIKYFNFFLNLRHYAVDLFFILSGYILNYVYLGSGDFYWRTYFNARIARIIPLYVLTTLLLLPFGLTYVGTNYLRNIIYNIFMVSGIVDGPLDTINGPAWSIGVEFFCYVAIFPLLWIAYRVLKTKTYQKYTYIFIIILFSFALFSLYNINALATTGHWSWNPSWLGRGVAGFTIGFFICSTQRIIRNISINQTLITLVILFCIIAIVIRGFDYGSHVLIFIAMPLLAYFSAIDNGVFAEALNLKPLQWLGDRSYSIYLWHIPTLAVFPNLFNLINKYFANTSTSLSVSINMISLLFAILIVSEVSYRYFEGPCRRYIRQIGAE